MKLLTKELKEILPPIRAQEHAKDLTVYVKFFTPDSNWTWYATEGESTEEGDYLFFGFVIGFEKEWGYFLLSDLELARGPMGLAIERDLYFEPQPFRKVRQAD